MTQLLSGRTFRHFCWQPFKAADNLANSLATESEHNSGFCARSQQRVVGLHAASGAEEAARSVVIAAIAVMLISGVKLHCQIN